MLTPAQIVDLLNFALRSTYFQYDGEIYEHQDGAAIGYPVSAVIANLYMEDPQLSGHPLLITYNLPKFSENK